MQSIGVWGLREEARKSWDHVSCNECVYFAKPYVRNDLWFHIRWAQLNTRQTGNYYEEALIECVHFDEASNACGKLDSRIAAVNGDGAVFVEVPEFVELPEGFGLYSIRSVARLKRIKNGMNASVKQSALLPVGIIGATDRKGDLIFGLRGGNRAGKQIDQVPSKLVEGSAEAVDEVSHTKSDFLRGSPGENYEHMLRQIRIVLFADRIRIAVNPVAQSFFTRLEVKVSPSGFHVYVLN